jgi:hypothetical protein
MLRLSLFLLGLLTLAPPPPAPDLCPAGAQPRGYAPPDGNGWECVVPGEHGVLLRHGWAVDYWPNGNEKSACEYDHGELHGRCSEWDEAGHLMVRGRYEAGQPVGYWWFWEVLGMLGDPDGAVARKFAEKLVTALGCGEGEAPALAQFLLEQAFAVQTDIRAAPQVCTSRLCVSAANVDGRGLLAVQFQPPQTKADQSASELARAAKEASAAQALIDRAQKKRDKAREKAEAGYEAQVHRWDYTQLQCVDGTRSPSCICGGSWQGCCSHHGGVAGCPKDYPEAPAPDTSPLVPNEFVEKATGGE